MKEKRATKVTTKHLLVTKQSTVSSSVPLLFVFVLEYPRGSQVDAARGGQLLLLLRREKGEWGHHIDSPLKSLFYLWHDKTRAPHTILGLAALLQRIGTTKRGIRHFPLQHCHIIYALEPRDPRDQRESTVGAYRESEARYRGHIQDPWLWRGDSLHARVDDAAVHCCASWCAFDVAYGVIEYPPPSVVVVCLKKQRDKFEHGSKLVGWLSRQILCASRKESRHTHATT